MTFTHVDFVFLFFFKKDDVIKGNIGMSHAFLNSYYHQNLFYEIKWTIFVTFFHDNIFLQRQRDNFHISAQVSKVKLISFASSKKKNIEISFRTCYTMSSRY